MCRRERGRQRMVTERAPFVHWLRSCFWWWPPVELQRDDQRNRGAVGDNLSGRHHRRLIACNAHYGKDKDKDENEELSVTACQDNAAIIWLPVVHVMAKTKTKDKDKYKDKGKTEPRNYRWQLVRTTPPSSDCLLLWHLVLAASSI